MQMRALLVLSVTFSGCSVAPSASEVVARRDTTRSWAGFGSEGSGAQQSGAVGGASGVCRGSSNADKSSTDTTWSQGLTVGPNGPIPLIVVDQFGYRRSAAKVAVIRDPQTGYDSAVSFTPGANYAVIDTATGTTVKRGKPIAWKGGATDASSGDKAYWFDFSDVTTPGTYTVVDVANQVRSMEFDVDDNVYRRVLKHALRMYFYQRAGFAKTAATVGADWADGASHLGPHQDPEANPWVDKTNDSLAKDLRGGWFDAGDFNKYTSWTAHNVRVLLRAYEENRSVFTDDFGIAESGNGIPDILDEVKWGLDWVVRMQNDDGSLLCILGVGLGSPPSAVTDPSYYGPPTTEATLSGALAFAYASKVFAARPEGALKAYAAGLAVRAKKAWDWASANPRVLYYNNDGRLQPGSEGLGGGQQETDDAGRLFTKLEAAVYLYEITGDTAYRAFVEANYKSVLPIVVPSLFGAEKQDVVLYYSQLPGVPKSTKADIVAKFVSDATHNADQLPLVVENTDPYRAPLARYVWGSNFVKASQARLYQLLARYATNPRIVAAATHAAEGYVHYINGVNPLGLVYLSNMKRAGAENSVKTMFHFWFQEGSPRWDEVSDTTPGPAPGFLAGGPNPEFKIENCCTSPAGSPDYQCYGEPGFSYCSFSYRPPMGQPDQKSYLQFNADWPVNSYEITEPSDGYQAEYIAMLAPFVR